MRAKVIALPAVGLIVLACTASPSEALATRLREAGSPLVGQVVYRPANFLDPAEVDVWLKLGTTADQANELWCQVIEPAGGSHVEGDTGVVVWNYAGTEIMAADVEC